MRYELIAAVTDVATSDYPFTCRRCNVVFATGVVPFMTRLIVIQEGDPERRAVQIPLCQECGEPFQVLAAIRLACDQLSTRGGVAKAAEHLFEATRWVRVIELLQEEAKEVEQRLRETLQLRMPTYFPELDSVAEQIRREWERTRKPVKKETPHG